MFVIDPERHSIDWQGKAIISLIQSINQPMVAAADYPAEETQAYVITLQAPDRSLSTYVYFHLQRSNRSVVYFYDQAPFMGDRLVEAETEAVDFVESMGFMMDNLRFDRLGAAEKEKLQSDVPIFYPTLKDFEPVLRKRQKRADDPLATSDSGAEIEPMEQDSGPTDEMSEGEVLVAIEEVVEVNDLSGLSELSKDLRDTLDDSSAATLPEPVPRRQVTPDDALDQELSEAFSEMGDDDPAPNLDATLVLPKKAPKPPEGMNEDSLAAFFEPPAAGSDDLKGLEEMEKRLKKKPAAGGAAASVRGAPLSGLSEDDLKHLLSLFLSV